MLNKFILIIDDDKNTALSIKNQIYKVFGESFNYEIANSSEEGLLIVGEILNEIDILVTISDWLMPGMKGDQFLIELHKIVPDALKLMVTGHANQESIQRAFREANLFKVFGKPWNEAELIFAIQKFLNN